MLCDTGEQIAVVDSHYYESENWGSDFTEEILDRKLKCAHGTDTLFAGMQHIHFYANMDFARNFVKACAKYKKAR